MTQSGSNDVAAFETIITFDKLAAAVRMGMSTNVEIEVARKDEVLTIPTQSVVHRRPSDLPPRLAEVVAKENLNGSAVKEAHKRYFQVVFVEVDGKAECRIVTTGNGPPGGQV